MSRTLGVLISGRGSNLQAILDAAASGAIQAELCAVVSDRADAYGLQRAQRAGVPAHVLEPAAHRDREAYDATLARLIAPMRPGLIALAGFMRILSPAFVARFHDRMLNVHPALLPAYKGLHTHARALAAGEKVHGASVHFVTEELDAGPVVVQARVPVLPGDDPERLSARVQQVEHKIYPRAIGWFAAGRLALRDERAWLDGEPLLAPVVYEARALLDEDESGQPGRP